MVQLSIRNLTKTFERGSPNEKVALDDVTLEIEKGDFVTILGSNGAGKSTLFNAVLGKFPLDRGRIVLDGTAAELLGNPDVQEFYLGLSHGGEKRRYRDVKHYRRRKRWLG